MLKIRSSVRYALELSDSFVSLSITLNVCGMGEYDRKQQKQESRTIANVQRKSQNRVINEA